MVFVTELFTGFAKRLRDAAHLRGDPALPLLKAFFSLFLGTVPRVLSLRLYLISNVTGAVLGFLRGVLGLLFGVFSSVACVLLGVFNPLLSFLRRLLGRVLSFSRGLLGAAFVILAVFGCLTLSCSVPAPSMGR